MADAVAESGAAVVIMHNRESVDPDLDIEADIKGFFVRSLVLADRAGIPRARILLDPGVGFGKTRAQNLKALALTARLRETFGLPILIGASRKRLFRDLPASSIDEAADRHARRQPCDARARRVRIPRPRRRRARRRLQGVRGHRSRAPHSPSKDGRPSTPMRGEGLAELLEGARVRGVAIGGSSFSQASPACGL